MQEGKTIGQLMEEMRQKARAQNYHGHDYMDLGLYLYRYSAFLPPALQAHSHGFSQMPSWCLH